VALYAIGDVQGCDEELGQLIKLIRFNPDRDQLWFVGDLVNRGPDSLAVLRRVRSLADNAVVTLGNHDLHLIALAFGKAKLRKSDTLKEVLGASDLDSLLAWLIDRPFMHEDRANSLALLHAGLPPQWDMRTARACAREAHLALAKDPQEFLAGMYGDQPLVWDAGLKGADRARFITNCFTRLRYLHTDGSLNLREKESPAAMARAEPTRNAADPLIPWFEHDAARWRGTHIVFGHWSTLGFFRNPDVTSLDTGCGWGSQLTALQLDRPHAAPLSIDCARHAKA
jgi:bis(5'-nucleosyl)-tetraphosphatase (symmetrical)